MMPPAETLESNAARHPPRKIAVIGAGLAGLVCAQRLHEHAIAVTVFEKSRGVGGRMATRRAEGELQFDHGAQYFTVRDEQFAQSVEAWRRAGCVALWKGRIGTLTRGHLELKQQTTPRFVGVPGMNAMCRELSTELDVRFGIRVEPPERNSGQWELSSSDGESLGQHDAVIMSAPAPQSAALLAAAPSLQRRVASVTMHGCWAVLLAFDQTLELDVDGAFVHDSPLSWIARNGSKPGRTSRHECWVLHASAEWTQATLDESPEAVQPRLVEAFWQATGLRRVTPMFSTCHRWRFAIPTEPLEHRCLYDADLRVGACGDWCSGPRVEGAFLSGLSASEHVLNCTPCGT